MASSVTAFACLLCNYSSDRKSNLESHVRTIHEKVKEHACDLCSYRSSRKGNVVQHRRTVHEGKKDFVCGLCSFKSSRKFNLNQHVERVHKGQQQLALNPQVQQIKIEQVQQDPQQQQQQIVVHQQLQQPQDQHQPLQIVQQQQHQQHQPLQIQLHPSQQQVSPPQIQTISLNPPTMVGAGGLQGLKIENVAVPVTSVAAATTPPQQQQQQTVTASLVMQPPKPGQTGPPVFTLNFPSQPVPVQQQQLQQQQQVHVQQVHVQQVQPLTVTVKRKTPKTHDCKFCNYKTSKEKNLRIHLEAIHPGVSNASVGAVAAAVSNQVPTITVPSQPAFPTHAVSGIDHFLSASAVSSNSSTPVAMHAAPAAVTTLVHATPAPHFAQSNIQVLAPHPQQPQVLIKNRNRANTATIAKAADWRRTRGRVFICDACPFTTSYERNLKAHVKEVHLKEKRVHSCHICNRFKSSRRSNLTQHIRTIHDGIKDFSCALCDFQSSRKRSLEKHAANAHGMNR